MRIKYRIVTENGYIVRSRDEKQPEIDFVEEMKKEYGESTSHKLLRIIIHDTGALVYIQAGMKG